MIGRPRLERAFDAYHEAETTNFAAQMAGFDYAELLRFAEDATRDVARGVRLTAPQRTLLTGVMACGVLIGAAVVRQGAAA